MRFVFNKTNTILLIIAILATIVGYIVMSTGDKTISPIILVIAYVVLFPAAIMVGTKKNNDHDKL
ncbi:MAG TPA: hypothetical protein PLD62_06200 [Candidatus Cloacimonadota bacterium]|nr:hypothetical protein [Candidatus Cloacimonadota bacterium]